MPSKIGSDQPDAQQPAKAPNATPASPIPNSYDGQPIGSAPQGGPTGPQGQTYSIGAPGTSASGGTGPTHKYGTGSGGTTGGSAGGTGGTGGTTGANGQTLTTAEQSVYQQIQATLSGYGFTPAQLTSLMAFVTTSLIDGDSATQITNAIPDTTAFQQRFPAIAARQAAGLPPITVADYLSTEQSYAQAEQAAGLPANWASYDNLIANDVSPAEFSNRLTQGFEVINNAPPDVQAAFQDYYAAGISPSALAAYFLDPKKGAVLLAQQAQSALIGQAAQQAGYNAGHQYGAGTGQQGLSQAEALRLSQMNVTQNQAQQGFSKIAQEAQVTGTLPGQGQKALTQDQVLNATFGSDGASQQQINLNEQEQKNQFNRGVAVGSTQTGMTGIGVVQR